MHKITNKFDYKLGDFPVSEDCSKRIFSIPMHPYLTPEEQDTVIKALNDDK